MVNLRSLLGRRMDRVLNIRIRELCSDNRGGRRARPRAYSKCIHVKEECARVLHEALLVPVLMCGSDTKLWKEKERSRVRAEQMDNLR